MIMVDVINFKDRTGCGVDVCFVSEHRESKRKVFRHGEVRINWLSIIQEIFHELSKNLRQHLRTTFRMLPRCIVSLPQFMQDNIEVSVACNQTFRICRIDEQRVQLIHRTIVIPGLDVEKGPHSCEHLVHCRRLRLHRYHLLLHPIVPDHIAEEPLVWVALFKKDHKFCL